MIPFGTGYLERKTCNMDEELDLAPLEARGSILTHTEAKQLIQEVKDTRAALYEIEGRLSDFLSEVTGGLLSKSSYDARTMVSHTDEAYEKIHQEGYEELKSMYDRACGDIQEYSLKLKQVKFALDTYKHWNEDCGWDVPAITIQAALDATETTREGTPQYVFKNSKSQ